MKSLTSDLANNLSTTVHGICSQMTQSKQVKSHTVTNVAIGTPSNKSVLRLEQNAGNADRETTLPKYVAPGQLNHYTITVSKRR